MRRLPVADCVGAGFGLGVVVGLTVGVTVGQGYVRVGVGAAVSFAAVGGIVGMGLAIAGAALYNLAAGLVDPTRPADGPEADYFDAPPDRPG